MSLATIYLLVITAIAVLEGLIVWSLWSLVEALRAELNEFYDD